MSDEDPANPGCVELDLYVTTGLNDRYGYNRELETNVCVLIRDGEVIGATAEGRLIAGLKAKLGFPLGGFDDLGGQGEAI